MDKNLTFSKAISPKIHRYLYSYSIKRFIEQRFEKLDELIMTYGINPDDDMKYSYLLDELIYNNKLDDNEVDDFLLKELNYGRAKNVFVSFIQEVSHLRDDSYIYKLVQKLETKGYKNAYLVDKHPFIKDLRKGIPKGEERLIFFDIEKDEENSVKNVAILLAKGIVDNNGNECNYYIGVEINVELKMLVIKLRNWDNILEENYGLNTLYKSVQDTIKNVMNLTIPLLTATAQKIVYNMINELSSKVLDAAVNRVNDKLEDAINFNINEWANKVLSEDVQLPPNELDVIKQTILNNFYRVYMQNEIGVLKVGTLKDIFNVDGYPRYVKFKDDTIGEGRAKSSDPRESLLDTSIYYDIKARLDQAKQIKSTTVYWIDSPDYDYLGTTFYTDNQEHFRFVVLANFFNKEICEYVLRQIDRYRPT